MAKLSVEVEDDAIERLKELSKSVDLKLDELVSGILNKYALGGTGYEGGKVNWGYSATGEERLIIVEWPRIFMIFKVPVKR